ncbi:MAG: hypothetical protein JKY66_06585 [Spongiibacteraceae bacterium]|nr:hypothetical protein [Spongiibacteraceae bacterium]MBN4055296.1 hypothetical protein [bacterium AH-315-K03]
MAKEYFQKLSDLIDELKIENTLSSAVEVKHFFSGAALYIDGTLCVSWSPVGLAFKLPGNESETLITKGKAIPLKYFAKGHIKKGYALFENPNSKKPKHWEKYFLKAIYALKP